VVVALAGVGCAIALYLSYHKRPSPVGETRPPVVTASETSRMEAGEYTRRKDGRETLSIKYAQRTTYDDGRIRFEQAAMKSYDEHALQIWADVVESKSGGPRSENPAELLLNGHVRLRTKDGLEALMDSATYNDVEGTLVTPGHLTFSRGRMSGEGNRATYLEREDVLSLLDQARIRVAPDEHGKGALDATSHELTLRRPMHLVRLENQARIVRDGDILSGTTAFLYMTPDESRLTKIELRQQARVEPGATATAAAPPDMRADAIDLDLHEDGQMIRRAGLTSETGVASVDTASETGHRVIEGAKITLELAPDGETLTRLDADQRVTATLPKTPDTGARRIEADTLRSAGQDHRGLTAATFEGRSVSYGEELLSRRGSGANTRTVTSQRLDLNLDGQLDAIKRATFTTRVELKDPDGNATADIADYDPGAKRMFLRMASGSASLPLTFSGDRQVTAREIDLYIGSNNLDARIDVKTQVKSAARSGDDRRASPLFTPGPVITGSADELKYVGSTATYTGKTTPARLKQQERRVSGKVIIYDSEANDLEARDSVDAVLIAHKSGSSGPPTKYTVERASSLVYKDAARTAVFKGSAVEVHSTDGDTTARTFDVKFAQGSGAVQQMVWDGNVSFRHGGSGRRGIGNRLRYDATTGRYELTGSPAEVLAPQTKGGPDCGLSRDEKLTFEDGSGEGQGGLALATVPCNTPLPYKEKEPEPMATLRTEGLTKSYGGRTVVRDINLDVSSGEIVGLLGPNGAGKTTTFSMVVGLTGADAGQVLLDDERVTADPMYVRARKGIGYLPQEPSVFRGLTVEKNVLAILETQSLTAAERRRRLAELLGELNLTLLAHAKAYSLSGGERRRVEITRALVNQPKFMLLDEPFAGIDPIAVGDIQKIIFHLRDRGIGVLITDHNVRETLKITDRAYIVHGGVIFRSGTPASLAADDEVKRIYLGADFRLD
jgi:lipopolysaccharide export system ATP-binding protein